MKNTKSSRKGLTLKQKEAVTGLIFISLPLLSLIIMMYYPIIRSFFISFFDWNLLQKPKFIGIQNYKTLIHDEVFKQALTNTFKWVIIYVPMSTITSFLLALLLDRKLKGAGFFRTLYYLPVVCPIVVVSLLFVWIYNTDYGILNFILKNLFHMDPIGWLTDSKYSLFAIAIMSVWKWAGYNMLIFLSALQGIDESLYEAAAIDGITPWRKLIDIKIPLVMPSIYFVMLTAVIDAFQIFTEIFIMTKGGPGYSTYTVSYYLWSNAFEYSKMGYACAMAAVMFVIILTITLIQNKVMSKKVDLPQIHLKAEEKIVYIPNLTSVLVIYQDITKEEKAKEKRYRLKMETIDAAQKVIDKQMMVAQEIAGLLGETTAETKVTLTKLRDSILMDEEE